MHVLIEKTVTLRPRKASELLKLAYEKISFYKSATLKDLTAHFIMYLHF